MENNLVGDKKIENLPIEPKSGKSVKLTFPDGKEVELPILDPALGDPMIDIRKLYALTGHFTYDPGFTCTGSCPSKLTFIDGNQGILAHRGNPSLRI